MCSAITFHLIQAAPQKILLHTFQCLENFGSFSTLRPYRLLRLTPDFLFQAKSSSPNKLLEIKNNHE